MSVKVVEEHKPSEMKEKAKKEDRPFKVKKWYIDDRYYLIKVYPEGEYKLYRQDRSLGEWREIESDTNFRELEKEVNKNPTPNFYHGTNHESAKEILGEGLKADKIGSNFSASEATGRFDNGVYLATNPKRASMWAQSDKVTDAGQAPVVLEIDSSYIKEEKLKKDVKATGYGDRIYSEDIPAEAVSIWSINPFDQDKVRKCADVFDRSFHINKLNQSEHQDTVDEFEEKCEMPFNRP